MGDVIGLFDRRKTEKSSKTEEKKQEKGTNEYDYEEAQKLHRERIARDTKRRSEYNRSTSSRHGLRTR